MSVDKLVDSTQLDSDLTSVANAIRTKGGTSAQLAFPADFVQAIDDIETGGGYSVSASFVQGDNKIFTTDDLSELKKYLTVTVTYSDTTTEVLPNDAYTLFGALTVGESTITVTALNQSATVSVTVTAATDVTPDLSQAVASNKMSMNWDAETGELQGYLTNGQQYSQWGQLYLSNYQVEAGMRYRITAKVVTSNPYVKARIAFLNTSNSKLMAVTNQLSHSGDLYYDGNPSNSANYKTPANLCFYITGSPSTNGDCIFSKAKIIKYADD